MFVSSLIWYRNEEGLEKGIKALCIIIRVARLCGNTICPGLAGGKGGRIFDKVAYIVQA